MQKIKLKNAVIILQTMLLLFVIAFKSIHEFKHHHQDISTRPIAFSLNIDSSDEECLVCDFAFVNQEEIDMYFSPFLLCEKYFVFLVDDPSPLAKYTFVASSPRAPPLV